MRVDGERPTCETCRFAAWTGTQYRECRRHAPIARDEKNRLGGVIQAHWPMVEARDWCGNHEPAPPPTKPCPTCSGGHPGLLDDGSGAFTICDECHGSGNVRVTVPAEPSGKEQK